MRRLIYILLLALALPAVAADAPSKQDMKLARQAYQRGIKLQSQMKTEEALAEFEHAAELVPTDIDYIQARELVRQQAVFEHVHRANQLLTRQQKAEAIAEFRQALTLDPENTYALDRMRDLAGPRPAVKIGSLAVRAVAEEPHLQPKPGTRNFHFQGESKVLWEQIGSAFGLTLSYDSSFASRRVTFNVDNVDFDAAAQAAALATKTFWQPVSSNEILLMANTQDARRAAERFVIRDFYFPDATTPAELNEIIALMRTMFDLRFINVQASQSLVTIRGPASSLDAVARLMRSLSGGEPQVLLDLHVYEISHHRARNLGINWPLQFRIFNIPTEVGNLVSNGGANLQDLLARLAAGTLTTADLAQLAGLLAQLAAQPNSILSTPIGTFGGGRTLTGIGLPAVTANFSESSSDLKSLEHVTLRAGQGSATTFRSGTRFPVVTSAFTGASGLPAQLQSTALGSLQGTVPIPSINYEDLGLTLKATPRVSRSDVRLDLELAIKALGGAAFNGVPVISNREYKGSVTLAEGETAILTGTISDQEMKSTNGIPGISRLPILAHLAGNVSTDRTTNELLVTITPYVVRGNPVRPELTETWLPSSF